MPIIDEVAYEPDEAVAKSYCPECGRPLAEVDHEQHISAHWPRLEDTSFTPPEARKRAELIRAHAKKHPKPAPPDPIPLTETAEAAPPDSPKGDA